MKKILKGERMKKEDLNSGKHDGAFRIKNLFHKDDTL